MTHHITRRINTAIRLSLLTLILHGGITQAETTQIGAFSNSNSLKQWEGKSFKGEASYELVTLDGKQVLKADSDKTASALFKEQEVDLRKTPYLNWSWRIENRLPNADETSKSGDDYAARLYVVVDGGLLIWRTIALNYVWANGQPQGKDWDNAFAGSNAKMLSLRDKGAPVQTWITEKRNVLEDFKRYYPDRKITTIDGVALMSDTDNAKGKVTAYYGDIYFSSE